MNVNLKKYRSLIENEACHMYKSKFWMLLTNSKIRWKIIIEQFVTVWLVKLWAAEAVTGDPLSRHVATEINKNKTYLTFYIREIINDFLYTIVWNMMGVL